MADPPNKSAVRELAEPEHVAFSSLAEAQSDPHGVVILEGDYGGQIYVVARASLVRCDEGALRRLLEEIDSRCWEDPDGASVLYERRVEGEGIVGGMGGAVATAPIWVHPELESLGLRARIEAVITGTSTR
jgi:hypothetical protein